MTPLSKILFQHIRTKYIQVQTNNKIRNNKNRLPSLGKY